MAVLFEHTGKVTEVDTFTKAVEKIEEGIKKQTNQATARFKLFTKMAQGDGSFADWYPQIRNQADRCIWDGYNAKYAAMVKNKGKMVASGVPDDMSREAGGPRERFQMMVVQMINQAIRFGRKSGPDDQQLEELINRGIIDEQGL